MVVAKLHKRYHVDLTLKPPKVAYRETIRGKSRRRRQTQKAIRRPRPVRRCRIKMEPAERGKGIEFVDDIFGGSIPKNWIPSVEKGIRDAAARGYLAGFPVVDFRVSLYDGKYHDVDSSDMAFKIAGSLAFKEAMKAGQAGSARARHARGGVCARSILRRFDGRSQLAARANRGKRSASHNVVIKAQVPFAEMLTYANDLISKTQGRATYSMEFSHYDYVPNELAEKVIASHKPHGGEQADEEV